MSNRDNVRLEARERYSETSFAHQCKRTGFIAGRTVDVKQIDAVARQLANLEEGEPWPTNEQLGGNMTGTRDDEFRWSKQEEAEEVLSAAGFIVRGGL